MVTCDLIPLAVLKPLSAKLNGRPHEVTCDLIPLAVLKPHKLHHRHIRLSGVTCDLIPLAVLKRIPRKIFRVISLVTCDLIPLAVLKLLLLAPTECDGLESHVTSYRLRFGIKKEPFGSFFMPALKWASLRWSHFF